MPSRTSPWPTPTRTNATTGSCSKPSPPDACWPPWISELGGETGSGDNLFAQRAHGLVGIVHADHREEQAVGDADRQQQVGGDAGVGELAERGRARPRLVVHPDRQRGARRKLEAGVLEHRLGARLVI